MLFLIEHKNNYAFPRNADSKANESHFPEQISCYLINAKYYLSSTLETHSLSSVYTSVFLSVTNIPENILGKTAFT
jgi:hypothetical protein